jgi:nitroreductase
MKTPAAAGSLFDAGHRPLACPRFAEEPVDDETLATLLDAATKAPSSENLQPSTWPAR